MAAAPSPPRLPRPKGSQPSHYYESFLEKKGPYDQDYRKLWAGLQGCTIYFYNSNRDFQHVEKLDIRTFVRLTDGDTGGSTQDCGVHFSLILQEQEIKFKVESLECREMWKGFIVTVVELRVPSSLTLLPGHLYMMAEALAKEDARRALEVPSCFLKVSRLEARLLLERYPECGNLLLRPSGDGTGVSITTRQVFNGTPEVRHYKVKRQGLKYVIDMEDPFSCASLDAVVSYFVSHTKRALVPFLLDEDYEKVLGYMDADKESGESVWVVPSGPHPGNIPSPCRGGGVPTFHSLPHTLSVVRPELRDRNDPDVLKPPPPAPLPVCSPETPAPPSQEDNYVIPTEDLPAADYENQDEPKNSRSTQAPKKPPGSMPQAFHLAAMMGDVKAELEEKLQRRRALDQ
ncbi:signal-transducing adaptor protein 2 [Ctenodactylus gundi]